MEYKVYVGSILKIKIGFLKGSFSIVYCGMPNESTFALSPFMSAGYQGFSPNIYYNANATRINIFERGFDVVEVTSEYIILGE